MFDSLTDQISAIVSTRRQDIAADLLATHRRPPEAGNSGTVVAAPQIEDQVLLGGSAPPPAAPLPLKPDEPAATPSRVSDVLRRPRGIRRKPAALPQPAYQEPEHEPSVGQIVDRWF